MAIVYVSEKLSTAVVFGEGFAEDVVFDGIPMRRVSLEWLSWLRKSHKGTRQDAERLAGLLREYPQEERHSEASQTPGACYVDWEDPDCGAEGIVDSAGCGQVGSLHENGAKTNEAGGYRLLSLWGEEKDIS